MLNESELRRLPVATLKHILARRIAEQLLVSKGSGCKVNVESDLKS